MTNQKLRIENTFYDLNEESEHRRSKKQNG